MAWRTGPLTPLAMWPAALWVESVTSTPTAKFGWGGLTATLTTSPSAQ
jgi:hypothetical protein